MRFYFDPNSIVMASGDMLFISYAYSGTSDVMLRVQLRFASGAYQLRTALLDDSATWENSNWFTISDAPHAINLDWQAATAVDANDGSLVFWIDGIQEANLTDIDNDTLHIDRIRLGAVASVDPGTRGIYFLDDFVSSRQPFLAPAIMDPP